MIATHAISIVVNIGTLQGAWAPSGTVLPKTGAFVKKMALTLTIVTNNLIGGPRLISTIATSGRHYGRF